MKPERFNFGDVLGFLGLFTATQAKEALELVALGVTIAAMAPLAYWRLRAVLRNDPRPKK